MTDEEKEDDEYDDDENLSEEERRNRWKRQWLRRAAEKATRKLEKGRKVDKGFEAAFASGENAHKFIRRHEFKYAAEPKDKVPESKPAYGGGEPWKEPGKWAEPKHTEEYPARKKPTETLQIPEKPIIEHGRREQAERPGQPDGENNHDVRKAEAHVVDKREDYTSEDTAARIEVEAPRNSMQEVASQIASRFEDRGYERISTETGTADYAFEPSFPEDDLERMEASARDDSISQLELSETHEALRQREIENVLDEQKQEMLQDFEIQPPFHDDIAGLTEAASQVAEALPEPELAKPKQEVEDV